MDERTSASNARPDTGRTLLINRCERTVLFADDEQQCELPYGHPGQHRATLVDASTSWTDTTALVVECEAVITWGAA